MSNIKPNPKFQPNDVVQATYPNGAIIVTPIEYIRYDPENKSWVYSIRAFGQTPEGYITMYEYIDNQSPSTKQKF